MERSIQNMNSTASYFWMFSQTKRKSSETYSLLYAWWMYFHLGVPARSSSTQGIDTPCLKSAKMEQLLVLYLTHFYWCQQAATTLLRGKWETAETVFLRIFVCSMYMGFFPKRLHNVFNLLTAIPTLTSAYLCALIWLISMLDQFQDHDIATSAVALCVFVRE